MKVLFVHLQESFFAGAEKMLQYFSGELCRDGGGHALVTSANPSFGRSLPSALPVYCLAATSDRFGVFNLMRLAMAARRLHRLSGFDVIHAWHARSWDAGALMGRLCGLPVVGTLHDHPSARFIGSGRRRIMKWSANRGLARVICVSNAVRMACEEAGYAEERLAVIHNGLPSARNPGPPSGSTLILGFLGAFSERKGIDGLFYVLDQFARNTRVEWRARIAGGGGESLMASIRRRHAGASWWHRVEFIGWTDSPMDFLQSVDLLVVPSSEFDPFPTVLLEAALMARPVLAADVGGVSEIVEDGSTGWLFRPRDWGGAASVLSNVSENLGRLSVAGGFAATRVRNRFAVEEMVARHLELYRAVAQARKAIPASP